MTVFAPRFTSHDPQVEEWWENQRVKSKSLELAIKLLVKQYGTVDIYDAAIESLTRSAGVVPVTEPVKKEVVPKVEVKPKKKVVEEPKQVKASEPTQIDSQELIAASEKPKAPVKKASPQELSPDDILAMMSNQAGSL